MTKRDTQPVENLRSLKTPPSDPWYPISSPAPHSLSRLHLNHLPVSWSSTLSVLPVLPGCPALSPGPTDWSLPACLHRPGLSVMPHILRIIKLFYYKCIIRNWQNMKLSKLEALSGSQLFLMNCCKDHCRCTNSMSAFKIKIIGA